MGRGQQTRAWRYGRYATREYTVAIPADRFIGRSCGSERGRASTRTLVSRITLRLIVGASARRSAPHQPAIRAGYYNHAAGRAGPTRGLLQRDSADYRPARPYGPYRTLGTGLV